jgi:CO dehydrogenase maturation factor
LKIAVAGKGGVGKTFIAAVIADHLATRGLRVLAVDADSSPNLGHMLGLSKSALAEIVPIADRADLIRSRTDTGVPGVYRLTFKVDDIIRKYSTEVTNNLHLMVMGTVKTAGEGCVCPANALLRALMRHLVVQHDEAIVLDMEAGLEHMGRGTAERVDLMIVVSEAGQRSLETANRLIKLAMESGIPEIALVGNKIRNEAGETALRKNADNHGVKLEAIIHYDEVIEQLELEGVSPLVSPSRSEAVASLRTFAEQIPSQSHHYQK